MGLEVNYFKNSKQLMRTEKQNAALQAAQAWPHWPVGHDHKKQDLTKLRHKREPHANKALYGWMASRAFVRTLHLGEDTQRSELET
jgi:hypothetical protein